MAGGSSLSRSEKRQTLRRYPALVLIVAAAALAILLPTALTIPSSGPPTLAEYAPVPGSGEGSGNLAELGAATSGGPGAGRATGSVPADKIGGPGQPRPRLKRCVGKPPRQTEDELSPPCVAFFEGDNGGATARGVTKDEVKVVLYVLATSARPAGTVTDYAEPIASNDNQDTIAIKAYMRYFNDRFQVYGRSVHFLGYSAASGGTGEAHRANATKVANELRAFATVDLVNNVEPYVAETARLGVVTFDFEAFARSSYQKVAPHLVSYLPDLEDQSRILASFICRRRAALPAKHSGNPQDVARKRVFGVLYQDNPTQSGFVYLKDQLKQQLRSQCGESIASEAPVASANQNPERVGQDTALGLARLRTDGVTTVFDIGAGAALYTNVAAGQGWYPEWIIGARFGPFGTDNNDAARQYNQASWKYASGITYDLRRPTKRQQNWYLAFREACPTCAEPNVARSISNMYDVFRLLFYAVQAAGPRLTSQSIDKGLHAIPERRSPNSDTPAAYFSSGNFSYIKDAMELWWDPTGTDPTDNQPACYRLSDDGKRFRAGDWPQGDTGAFDTGVCQGGIG